MVKPLSLIIFCLLTGVIFASEINIGDKKIILPSLDGMVCASSISQEIVNYMGRTIPSDAKILEVYLEQADALRLNSGQDALLDKYVIVVTPLNDLAKDITSEEFLHFKKYLRSQFDVLTKTEQKDVIGKNCQKKTQNDNVIPLGINFETDTSLSASMLLTIKNNSSNTNSETVTVITAVNCVLVKGKIIYIYAYKKYKTNNDLEWVKKTGRILSEQIAVVNTEPFFLPNDLKVFTVDGHPKAKGARFSIKMPAAWQWREGRRPNIVQFFDGGMKNGIISQASIFVKTYPGLKRGAFADFTEADASDPEIINLFITKEMKCIRSGITKLDGETVLWAETNMQVERVHKKVSAYAIHYVIPDDGRFIGISMAISRLGCDLNLQEEFHKYHPLFMRIISSFVLTSKWE